MARNHRGFRGTTRIVMRVLAILVAISACRSSKTPDRPPPPMIPRDRAAALPADAGPPPGTAEVVPVPAEIANKVTLKQIAKGLKRPVLVVAAPGDARRRLFVLEQHAGDVRILENGVVAGKPFLTIKDLSNGNEEGLLGLAFHPKFAENGRLYVNYTSSDMNTHIVEYRVSSDPDVVDPASARELANILQPFSNHNGGNLLFGPDGKLYTGMGDGGSANDPHKNGQNKDALLGKILRFDVEAPSPKPEIVHLGVRNPWRFWFDRPTGDLYIGDVGQNTWEEVDVLSGADRTSHNFGWNLMEGTHCFDSDDCDQTGLTLPVTDYRHDMGCSITGGVTYRGKALAFLDGRYFYADFCTGMLRSFKWTRDPSGATPGWIRDHWTWKDAIDPDGVLQQVTSFGVDADGEIYIALLTGEIYELVSSTR